MTSFRIDVRYNSSEHADRFIGLTQNSTLLQGRGFNLRKRTPDSPAFPRRGLGGSSEFTSNITFVPSPSRIPLHPHFSRIPRFLISPYSTSLFAVKLQNHLRSNRVQVCSLAVVCGGEQTYPSPSSYPTDLSSENPIPLLRAYIVTAREFMPALASIASDRQNYNCKQI